MRPLNVISQRLNFSCLQCIVYLILFFLVFSPKKSFGQLPSNFQKVELLTGLKNSVSIEFAPDGRIFILDRYGELIIYKPLNQETVSAGFLDVFHDMEDGLIGIAFDPQFSTNNFIYIHYSHSTLPKNRVSRFLMNGDILNVSSEKVMLEWKSDRNGFYHAAGDMDFDSNGNLYIAIGDNTNHSLYATLNEQDSNKSSERTSSNTNDLRGKILRIKPLDNGSYSIPEGNLFPNGIGGLPEIYVMGARNPYKIFVDKFNSDWLFWSEVGPDASVQNTQGPEGLDEINLTKEAGNYGWPYFSGPNRPYLNNYISPNFYYNPAQPTNHSVWNTGAVNLPYAKPSWMNFLHQCYLIGPRYKFDPTIQNNKKLPFDFNNGLFYFDFNTSKIWVAKMDNNGNLLSTEALAHDIITGAGFIDLKIGLDGQLYILEYGAGCCPQNTGTGKLVRIDYTGIDGNRVPEVNINANINSGPLPLMVNFSSEGTIDPDGDLLTYEWDFQSDGIVDSNKKNPTFTYTVSGNFNALLRVNDSNGGISSKSIFIGAGNSSASFNFISPPDGSMINWGDKVDVSLVVTDPEDGTTENGSIDCNDVNLVPSFGHLIHSHDGLTINDCKASLVLDPSGHDIEGFDDIYYILKSNYTDTGGLTAFDQITIHPKLAEAEFYEFQNNTLLVENTDSLGGGKHSVRALSHGSYIMFEKRNLLNINSVSYRVSAPSAGGVIQIRVGSPTGNIISSASIPSSNGFNNWINVVAQISNPGGTNDLYFVFTKSPGNTNLLDLNYIEFLGAGVSIDESPVFISFIHVISQNQVNVKFNEPVEKISSEQVANYSINNGITITSATLQADRRTVTLITSDISPLFENVLSVINILNESGINLSSSLTENFVFVVEVAKINAGGPALEINGIKWSQNQYNTGGNIFSNANLTIKNTNSGPIYQTEIFGNFSYNIPVPKAGIYNLKLHFAEIYFNSAGSRLFNVIIEDNQFSLINYDIFAKVGFATAIVEDFKGIDVTDGFLTITFNSIVDNAKISAIEVNVGISGTQQNLPPSVSNPIPDQSATVGTAYSFSFALNTFADPNGDALTFSSSLSGGSQLPGWLSFNPGSRTFTGTPTTASIGLVSVAVTASDGKGGTATDVFTINVKSGTAPATALRINAGGPQFSTAGGLVFTADQSFSGGMVYTNSNISDISGTTNDALYRSERHGNGSSFSYNFPLPSGIYTVRLHFAEIWFGATGGGPGAVGNRIFNITGEGKPLLTNFDIFAEAGAMTALVKEFQINVSDGTLNLSFGKVINNPKISAIEVISVGSPANQAPVANAGPDRTVTAGADGTAAVQLNSSGSSDPDGSIASYSWTSGATLLATGATPTVSLGVGTYTILLTVKDDQGTTGTDQLTVTVTSGTPQNLPPSVSNPISDQSATVGTAYSFSFALNTFADPNGDALTFSSSLSGGSQLPGWLSFSPGSRTFTGTPTAASIGLVSVAVTASDGKGGTATDVFTINVKSGTAPATALRINAGGPQFSAAGGLVFTADQSFSGGKVYTNSNISDISGTTNDAMYRSERHGNGSSFSYNFPLPSGIYTVRLHFAEIWFGATGGGPGAVGNRIFNITGEGKPLLTNFDIFAEAGAMTALIKEFQINVSDGTLNLSFGKVINNPKISAIEVISVGSSFRIYSDEVSQKPIINLDSPNSIEKGTTMDHENLVLTYPNPFENQIYIKIPAEESHEYRVSVFDGAGRIHFNGKLTSNPRKAEIFEIDLSNKHLSTGELFMIVIENEKFIKTFKMLKK